MRPGESPPAGFLAVTVDDQHRCQEGHRSHCRQPRHRGKVGGGGDPPKRDEHQQDDGAEDGGGESGKIPAGCDPPPGHARPQVCNPRASRHQGRDHDRGQTGSEQAGEVAVVTAGGHHSQPVPPGQDEGEDVEGGEGMPPDHPSPRELRPGAGVPCSLAHHSSGLVLTTRTSQGASWITAWLVEPSTREEKPPRPRVPRTIRSAPISVAYSTIAVAG